MTNLSPEICFKLKKARREAHLCQSEVAAEVGCKQSALSMFEQGKPTKLSEEVVEKLAKKFNVKLVEEKAGPQVPPLTYQVPSRLAAALADVRGFCPNPNCPSNRPYQVDGRTLMRPNREEADPVGGKFCACCGEVLEKRCPNCGAPVHPGAVCSVCGEPYVVV